MNRISKTAVLASVVILPMTGAGTASAAQASTPKASTASTSIPDGFFRPGSNTVVKRTASAAPIPAAPGVSTLASSGYSIKNVDGPNEVCGTTKLQKTSGAGKTTLVMTVSKSVSAELSSEVSVDAEVVSGKLGFKVTGTTTVEDQTRYEVPKGKYGYIEAYPLYDMYTFNVYYEGKNKGASWAMRPVGVCFNQWTD
ncbi:hypothetical protein [Streptomyces sp. TLI_185]|uniref:hypothetical protein n=1 Tax=Streptomyces sp. TLI_185 TaxID=2485151 RepID=UPI000FBD3804|nr:hypothetical protein [Streptomyces sp. TLI_185]RPF35146.1 hypothetical protein EDD92_5143 [Streptomyces sp. TLI_185]